MSGEQTVYQVELEVFEGPFDLLLDLILKQEVDIYEVPIAQITDGYLKYLAKMEDLNLELTSEFVVMAATLIELKSAALLPSDEEEFIETGVSIEEETRESLIEHLIEYKQIKNVSSYLGERLEAEADHYARDGELEEEFADLKPDFLNGVRLDDLAFLAGALLGEKHGFKIDTRHIAALKMSVAERAARILEQLKTKKRLTFKELSAGAVGRFDVIVVFLALLELYKAGCVAVSQTQTFGSINVRFVREKEVARAAG